MAAFDSKVPQDAPKTGAGAGIAGGNGGADSNEGFFVTISASARDPRDRTRYIHAVSVTQPVQSWTVIREHFDFVAVGDSLSSILPGLPPCPTLPVESGEAVFEDQQTIGEALLTTRNLLQEWLVSVLLFPGVRESPAIKQFLCHGANVAPPHFQGVSWLTFPTGGGNKPLAQQRQHAAGAVSGVGNCADNGRSHSLDEMEMDDMFDTGGSYEADDDDEEEDEEEDEAVPYSVRYPPTEEVITQEDRMEIHGEVEMIEDVGSLAQSLGASHLGRSLQLQAEIAHVRHHQSGTPPGLAGTNSVQQQQGVTVGGAGSGTTNGNSTGGIGGIVESARESDASGEDVGSRVAGLGDSFHQATPVSAPRLDSFEMIKVIGKGSFGKVFLVREIETSEMFALKVLRKENIIKRNQVEHTRTERSVLGYVKHPFIVSLNMAFQSKDKLYFVLDYCAGGELFFHLGKLGKFPEPRACFYTAEIVLAISYVHELDIVYRDLKPENVLLDARGHIRLTDFGLSKEGISGSSSGANSFCGTPEYLAPEILNRQGHGCAVDWWSLGALLYEMLTGLPPFYCRDREKLFEKIRKSELTYPRYLSVNAQSLLRGLLTKDPRRRLGSGPGGGTDIKQHPFFADVDWKKLTNGKIAPPWDPQISGSLDTSQFDNEFTSMPMFSPESLRPQGGFGGTNAQDNVFEGFTFTDRTFYRPGMET